MSYQQKLNPEIAGIVEDISNLNPGESLRLGPLANLSSIRWQVYSYLQTAGIKPYFVIKTRLPYIFVERKETNFKVEKIDRRKDLPDYLGEQLKLALTQDDPPKYIANLYQTKEITAAEFAELLTAYYETQQ